MSLKTLPLTDALHDYMLAHGVREAPVLTRLREETLGLGKPGTWQISPEQGQFMALLVELTGARRLLEVGCFTGYSSLVCALAMPADGHLLTCDIMEEFTAIARRYWAEAGVADRVELRLGPALETLDGLLAQGSSGRYDMAFIDADKELYPEYYERCLQLVRPGGLILIDNVFRAGRVIDPADQTEGVVALRRLNERIAADERVSVAIVPIADGITMIRRR